VEQPDRPGPEDQHDVADVDPELVDADVAARQRLGQGELLGREAVGCPHQLAGAHATLGDEHEVGERAVEVVADHPGVAAQVRQAGLAVPADAAGEGRADPAELADLVALDAALDAVAELDDRAGDLVAEDEAGGDAPCSSPRA
jgi:hypothetical protein